MKNKIQLESIFGSKFDNCKFKDYYPYVFKSIRTL